MYNFYLQNRINNLYHKSLKNRDRESVIKLYNSLTQLALEFVTSHLRRGGIYLDVYEVRDYMVDFACSYRDDNFCIDLINDVCYHFG